MTSESYLMGLGASVLIVGSAALVGRSLERLWRGPRPRSTVTSGVVTSTAAVGSVTVVSMGLGALGWFARPHLVAAMVVLAIVSHRTTRARDADPDTHTPDDRGAAPSPFVGRIAALTTALIAAAWLGRVITVYRFGYQRDDTLFHHLPVAMRFVQTGRLFDVLYVGPEISSSFDPSGGALVHAVAALAFGSDTLSPLVNLGWFALALAAAWTIGARWRAAPLTMLAVAAVLATPLITASQAGEGLTDLAASALFLSGCAVLASADRVRPWDWVIVGSAFGLALGAKLSVAVPAAVVLVGHALYVSEPGRRARGVLIALGAGGICAGGWFLRNLIETGTPLPHLALPGFPRRTFELNEATGYTTFEYLDDGRIVRDVFVPGLEDAFGIAWPLYVLAVLAAGVVVIRPRDRLHRLLAGAAMIAALGYLITPGSAFGLEGRPIFFAQNLRIALPAQVLAAVVLPPLVTRSERSARMGAVGVAVLAAITTVHRGDFGGWPERSGTEAIAAAAVLGSVAWFATTQTSRAIARTPALRLVAGAVVLGAVVVGASISSTFESTRVKAAPERRHAVNEWAATVEDVDIGFTGFTQQYPLYGARLDNRVQYIGVVDSGEFGPADDCRTWIRLVNRGGYDYVAIAPLDFETAAPVQRSWTAADPGVTEVVRSGEASVFRVDEPLDLERCG